MEILETLISDICNMNEINLTGKSGIKFFKKILLFNMNFYIVFTMFCFMVCLCVALNM